MKRGRERDREDLMMEIVGDGEGFESVRSGGVLVINGVVNGPFW
jgi:hypothetical protein